MYVALVPLLRLITWTGDRFLIYHFDPFLHKGFKMKKPRFCHPSIFVVFFAALGDYLMERENAIQCHLFYSATLLYLRLDLKAVMHHSSIWHLLNSLERSMFPFQACQVHASCTGKGMHTHHPRDCLYYVRDMSVQQLETLLNNHNIQWIRDYPEEMQGIFYTYLRLGEIGPLESCHPRSMASWSASLFQPLSLVQKCFIFMPIVHT